MPVELSESALTTVEYVREYLGFDDVDEARIAHLVNAASEMAERHIGRSLALREHDEICDGTGGKRLLLREFPVSLIQSVEIDPAGSFGAGTEVTDTRFDGRIGMLYREAGFPAGWRNVRVVYVAGYDPVPEDLQAGVCEVVSWLHKRSVASQIGLKSISGDGVNTEYELTMPTNAMRIFETYRRAYADG